MVRNSRENIFGGLLAIKLLQFNLKQKELAHAVGLSAGAVSAYCAGEYLPIKIGIILKGLRQLKVKAQDLSELLTTFEQSGGEVSQEERDEFGLIVGEPPAVLEQPVDVTSAPRNNNIEWLLISDAIENGEPNIFSLMRWDYRLVETLFGRDGDIRNILAWAENGSETPSARLVTGEGGVGKTRLAATAAQILAEKGWEVGFLPRCQVSIDWNVKAKGLFLIVDYPEERLELTSALLRELADRKTAPVPLRVLLLSRQSFADWERTATVLQGRFGQQELAAPEPLSVEDGAHLIEQAARNLAKHMKRTPPELRKAKNWLEASPRHRLPLYATAAAIHAVLAPTEAFGLGGKDVLKSLALREIGRVENVSTALGLGREGLARLLALGVLSDGLGEIAIKELAETGACESAERDIVGVLSRSPWWKNGRLIKLEPDPLGAAFLDISLFDQKFPKGRSALPEWLFIALHEKASTFGSRLERVLYDLQSLQRVTTGGLHPLNERLKDMFTADQARAFVFNGILSDGRAILGTDFAIFVAFILIDKTVNNVKKAELLNSTSVYLSNAGRREEALSAAQEAADLYRSLAQARPEAFTHELAGSLNNLATMLAETGRRDEALTAAQEAVDLCRPLAQARPEAFMHELATSLETLANGLSAVGRPEEAFVAAHEAVALYRVLRQAQPEAFTHDLALSLLTLANRLLEVWQRQEAVAAAQEAADLYRVLARGRPEVFTSNLAASLTTVAYMLSVVRRWREAMAAAQEAVDLYRPLAQVQPAAFTSNLAGSLTILSNMLSGVGRREEALAAAQGAADLSRRLAEVRPASFTHDLAASLTTLTKRLSVVGRREEALKVALEAADLYRLLREAQPEAFTLELAISLTILSDLLSAVERQEEALVAAQETTDLYRPLRQAQPDAFMPPLALSLFDLSSRLSAVGRGEEALAAAQEATDLYRALAQARPAAFTPELAGSLATLSNMLLGVGRREEAAAAAQEAVNIRRALASTGAPAVVHAKSATSLRA